MVGKWPQISEYWAANLWMLYFLFYFFSIIEGNRQKELFLLLYLFAEEFAKISKCLLMFQWQTGQKTNYQPPQMVAESRHFPLLGERMLINLQMKFIRREYFALMLCFNYDSEVQCISKDKRHKLLMTKKEAKSSSESLYKLRYVSSLLWNDLCTALLFSLLNCPQNPAIIVSTCASMF